MSTRIHLTTFISELYRSWKHESKSPLTGWRQRLLRHCSRCAARRYINPIPIYHLLDYVLRTTINLTKENGFKLAKERSRKYPAQTITDVDYADDKALLEYSPALAETQQHSLEQAASGIVLHVNADKIIQVFQSKRRHLHTQGWSSETNGQVLLPQKRRLINTGLGKARTAIDRLSVIWKSDQTDKIKRSFFQAAVVSILLYECTTWTLTKRMEKKIDGNYTRMLRAILNKSWRQYHSKQHL